MIGKIVGYYEDAAQESPTYEPGFEVDCPVCSAKLADPMVTVSLLLPGDSRSFFYRTHKSCYADDQAVNAFESSLIDTRAELLQQGGREH